MGVTPDRRSTELAGDGAGNVSPSASPKDVHTFVFADLAGYTALTEAHGDDYAADAAAEFCAAIRSLLSEQDAEEVNAIGDALLIRVPDALAAARLAERTVCEYGARHRALGIRVGIHTGTAVRRGEDWFGSGVNLAARVADVARAGEVLLTHPTREALGVSVAAHSRGRRSFKNVVEPIEIFELCWTASDRRARFPLTRCAAWPSIRRWPPPARSTAGPNTTSAPSAATPLLARRLRGTRAHDLFETTARVRSCPRFCGHSAAPRVRARPSGSRRARAARRARRLGSNPR